MKRVKYAIIILILIPVLIFTTHYYLKKITVEMSTLLSEAQSDVEKGNKESAEKDVADFLKEWHKHHTVMGTFIRHSELDTINLSAAKLKPYLNNDENGDFFAECETLKTQLKHVWLMEKFTIDNIF